MAHDSARAFRLAAARRLRRRGLRSRRAASTGFAWELKPDRLSIVHAGRPLADYVFSDPQVLRPHFQNLRAPSGVQVTRTHPPAAGDATDHDTMHPGVWLAFGDINGEDFWRNKARIEHVAFTTDPASRRAAHVCHAKPARCSRRNCRSRTQMSRFAIAAMGEHAFLLTWEAEIRGEGRELVFGDQEEMGLGVRVATNITEKAGGLVVNSEGLNGAKTVWGKPAAWAAYSREAGGRIQGVAIFPAVIESESDVVAQPGLWRDRRQWVRQARAARIGGRKTRRETRRQR